MVIFHANKYKRYYSDILVEAFALQLLGLWFNCSSILPKKKDLLGALQWIWLQSASTKKHIVKLLSP